MMMQCANKGREQQKRSFSLMMKLLLLSLVLHSFSGNTPRQLSKSTTFTIHAFIIVGKPTIHQGTYTIQIATATSTATAKATAKAKTKASRKTKLFVTSLIGTPSPSSRNTIISNGGGVINRNHGDTTATGTVLDDNINNIHRDDNYKDIIVDSVSSSQTSTTTNTIPLVQLAIAGCITTFFADVCMHPMDTIKTILQSDVGYGMNVLVAGQYVLDHGGIPALYSGFLTYAASDAVGGGIKFTIWELWKIFIIPSLQQKLLPVVVVPSELAVSLSSSSSSSSSQQQQEVSIAATTAKAGQQQQEQQKLNSAVILGIVLLWIGAAVSFVGSSIVIVPGEYIKQQLQMSHYTTLIDAITGTYALNNGNIGSFYTGYEGVLYRDVPYTMIELGLYEVLKQQQLKHNHNIKMEKITNQSDSVPLPAADSVAASVTTSTATATATISTTTVIDATNNEVAMAVTDAATIGMTTPTTAWYEEISAAAITGAVSSFCTTPLDTIKTKMMVDYSTTTTTTAINNHHDHVISFVDCFLDTIHQHGILSIFAGVTARMMWIIPFTVLYLPMYDLLKRMLHQYHSLQQPNNNNSNDGNDNGNDKDNSHFNDSNDIKL